jgi:hypothetical protein
MRVRRLAGLTAAGIAGLVVAPAIGLAPAAAADPCEKSLEYGATAAADLVKLGLLDFRPVGLGLGPVADVTLVSTKSGMNALNPVNSAAAARLLDAKLFGVHLPPGPLTQTVSQKAPPSNDSPATASVLAKNLGLLKIGAGDLSAHATWKKGMACGKEQGQNTDASAEIANATVLPGKDTGLVRTSLLSSATQTGLAKKGDQVFSVARASVGIAEITLFAGSRSAIKIEVIKPPTLAVGTAGTEASATVDYTAPILKITGPGNISQQINSPGDTVELGIPSSLPLVGKAQELAKAEGLPLLGDTPLDGLLGDLNKPDATAKADKGAMSLPGLPALPDVPDLPPAADIIGGAPESLPVVGSGALSLLRLTIGDVEKEVTDRAVRAEAASLRLEVLAGHESKTKSVIDVGLGLLSAAAVAPAPEVPVPPVAQPPSGGGGGLPVTGVNVGVIAGVGIVLLAGGGAMLIVGRRRRISVRG